MLQMTYDDLAQRMAFDLSATPEAAEGLIEQALRRLYRQVPRIDERVEAGTLDPELVKDVLAEAVFRVLRNSGSIYQSQTELGYGYTINKSLTAGAIYFMKEELALLRPQGKRRGSIPFVFPYPWGKP